MERFEGKVNLLNQQGLAEMYGEPVIFHCNHYNLYLQRTIEDAEEYIPSSEILVRGSAITCYSLLQGLLQSHSELESFEQKRKAIEDTFSYLGFGLLSLSPIAKTGGSTQSKITHYSFAWTNKWGKRDKPVDYFTCGYIQAACAVLFGKPLGFYKVVQTKCLTMGDETNEFKVTCIEKYKTLPVSPGLGVINQELYEYKKISTNLNEQGITDTIRGLKLVGNNDGLIPAFGVFLTRHLANYYNYISYKSSKMIFEVTGNPDLARELFVEAGRVCAFNTFGGIMESEEWYGLIAPNCKTKEDWISGIVAVVNALGWGYWGVTALDPGKSMTVRVDGSYESNGYLSTYPKSEIPRGYLLTGGSITLMNLLYNCDIREKPPLTEEFYQQMFSKEIYFDGIQVKCRTMGDSFCEVEIILKND